MNPKTTNEEYTKFIKLALNAGFSDEQADFMWEFMSGMWEDFYSHSHKDGDIVINN